jgi:virginiamycin B lyase
VIGRPVTGLLVLCACLFGLAAPAGAATITEFPLPEGPGGEKPRPIYIAANPNGTLWYTDLGRGVIGAVNTEGATVETIPNYPPSADLAFAPSGTLYWTTEVAGEGALASRTPKGTLKVEPESDTVEPYAVGFNTTGEAKFSALNGEKGTYAICSPSDCNSGLETEITDLSAGPGGVFWAMQPFSDIVRKLQPNGQITDLVVNLPENTRPLRGVLGPDGNLWVAGSGTEQTQNRIFRITSDGQQTSFLIPPGREPQDITVGTDGALWFTEFATNSIGRMTTSGEYSSCPLPSAASKPHPYGIATGSDGDIWFTEREGRKIGRLEGNCVPPPAPPSGGGGSGSSSQPGGGGAGGSGAGVKPVLSQLKITPAVFRVAGAGGKKAKGATGTTISFNLNEGADVAFAIERKAHGRLVGGKCKRQTRANKAKPGCGLFLPKGLLSMKGSKGQNSFRFGGRVGGKALAPGNYLLVTTAKNDAGASAAAQAGFKILGR